MQPENTSGTIKEELAAIAPILEQLWQQKEERVKEFSDVQSQIQKICGEITADLNPDQTGSFAVDESDLSLKKLDEYQTQLQELQKEKVTLLYHQNFCVSKNLETLFDPVINMLRVLFLCFVL